MTTVATLIILGASARAAAESAVRAGFTPYCIDLFADADTQALGPVKRIERYPAEFLPALAAAPQAPWMYTGSLENYPRLIARLAELRTLLGNGAAAVAKVRDPSWLASTLAEGAIRFPETICAAEESGVGSQEPGKWLSKPVRSGGGMGIEVAEFARIQLPKKVYQRFVRGAAFSASFLATRHVGLTSGRSPLESVQFIGAAGQWIGREWGAPQPFQYAGSYAPFVVSREEERLLIDLATRLAATADLRGLFGLDLIRSDEGRLWLIEVNPRYTASMELLEQIRGRSLVAEHCAALNCDLFPAIENQFSKQLSTGYSASIEGFISSDEPHQSQISLSKQLSTGNYLSGCELTHGKLIVYANRAGVAGDRYQHELAAIRTEMSVITADIPPAESVISQGSPICSLLSRGPTAKSVELTLITAAERVRQALAPVDDPS